MNRFKVAQDQQDLYKASLLNRAFSSQLNQNIRNNGKYSQTLRQLTQFHSTEIKGEGWWVIRNFDN
ncbi:hypothetical protein RB653_005677 [Dictyostelium firmibasis]|uniref:Uncharacterized protein n=1 Tax=Dictyostelium firmibasis TaxID=79012 RepID=A0AAN7UD33_9MYCE